jgi:hypothetical protein
VLAAAVGVGLTQRALAMLTGGAVVLMLPARIGTRLSRPGVPGAT